MSKVSVILVLVLVHLVQYSFENPFYWRSASSSDCIRFPDICGFSNGANSDVVDCCRCCHQLKSDLPRQNPVLFPLIAAPNIEDTSATIPPTTTTATTRIVTITTTPTITPTTTPTTITTTTPATTTTATPTITTTTTTNTPTTRTTTPFTPSTTDYGTPPPS